MRCSIRAGYQDIVQVYEEEGQAAKDPVHEALEGHASILQPEGHAQKFEEAKWCDDSRLLHVRGVDRYLVVALLQVELAEDGGPCQAAGDVCHVGEGVAVILGDQVQTAEITTWPP